MSSGKLKMKKGGKLCRLEPVNTKRAEDFLDCAELFRRPSWFSFFEKIIGYNMEVTRSFVQNCSNSVFEFQTINLS